MLLQFHRLNEGVKGVHHAHHVDIKYLLKHLQVVFNLGQRTPGDTRIGNHDIRNAETGDEIVGRVLQCDGVTHIQCIHGRTRLKFICKAGQEIRAPRNQTKLHASTGIEARH